MDDAGAMLLAKVEELMGEVRSLKAQVDALRPRTSAERMRSLRTRNNSRVTKNVTGCDEKRNGVTKIVTPSEQPEPAAIAKDVTPSVTPTVVVVVRSKDQEEEARTRSKCIWVSPLAEFVSATWPGQRVTEAQEAAWKESCPGVDLLAAAKAARGWQLEDKPRRQRPRTLVFLGNWFRTEQQRTKAVPIRPGQASLRVDNEEHSRNAIGKVML